MRKQGAGSKPGEHRGGRTTGVPNKVTIERLEQARIAEQVKEAEAARTTVMRGEKLAKDVLKDFMLLFAGVAASYQPIPEGVPVPVGHHPNPDEFKKWAQMAVDTAAKLAPYQSPTFRAIVVASQSQEPMRLPPGGGDNVVPINDPVAIARFYQRKITAIR